MRVFELPCIWWHSLPLSSLAHYLPQFPSLLRLSQQEEPSLHLQQVRREGPLGKGGRTAPYRVLVLAAHAVRLR